MRSAITPSNVRVLSFSNLKWVDKKGSRLDVPMDHFNKSSDKTFSIPLIRMLATNASASGDRHVFMNPGGPGGMLEPQ